MWVRNTQAIAAPDSKPPLIYPRHAFEFFADIHFHPDVTNGTYTPITDVIKQIQDVGTILTALVKSATRPTETYETTTLDAYNRKYIVKTRRTLEPITMVLYDDMLGYAASLLKEYRNFYEFTDQAFGNVNPENAASIDMNYDLGANPYALSTPSSTRVSGMRVRDSRVFFTHITLYDTGPNPHAMTAFTLIKPVITRIAWDDLSYDDNKPRTVTLTIDYEEYIHHNSLTATEVADSLYAHLGFPVHPKNTSAKPTPMTPGGIQVDTLPPAPITPDPEFGTDTLYLHGQPIVIKEATPKKTPTTTEIPSKYK
ncbi:MAG: hypothetical protein D6698_14045 [Gammaproteobacteria bacterium]|nr:MAG: hypothetical protein D6698_14045 [Gammaproteobacteria bacterium]